MSKIINRISLVLLGMLVLGVSSCRTKAGQGSRVAGEGGAFASASAGDDGILIKVTGILDSSSYVSSLSASMAGNEACGADVTSGKGSCAISLALNFSMDLPNGGINNCSTTGALFLSANGTLVACSSPGGSTSSSSSSGGGQTGQGPNPGTNDPNGEGQGLPGQGNSTGTTGSGGPQCIADTLQCSSHSECCNGYCGPGVEYSVCGPNPMGGAGLR